MTITEKIKAYIKADLSKAHSSYHLYTLVVSDIVRDMELLTPAQVEEVKKETARLLGL